MFACNHARSTAGEAVRSEGPKVQSLDAERASRASRSEYVKCTTGWQNSTLLLK